MKILVTGSAGHLGEALVRSLEDSDHEAIGLDVKSSPFTRRVGSITERSFVKRCMQGVDVVLHAATLHKPHIASHTRQDFVDANVTGTLNLLQEAVSAGVKSFDFTSTTSVFGHALTPQPRYDFGLVIDRLRVSGDFRSPLARAVGSKGYHAEAFS